ncbi:MAG TPA: hypothetical protein VE619_04950 [Nitrososphaeraceae archaeon]|nr:hypothetical protein [Nitrososphaeraceae archaeon]
MDLFRRHVQLERLPFEQARELVHRLGLKSVSEWQEYYKSNKPLHLPHTPSKDAFIDTIVLLLTDHHF